MRSEEWGCCATCRHWDGFLVWAETVCLERDDPDIVMPDDTCENYAPRERSEPERICGTCASWNGPEETLTGYEAGICEYLSSGPSDILRDCCDAACEHWTEPQEVAGEVEVKQ